MSVLVLYMHTHHHQPRIPNLRPPARLPVRKQASPPRVAMCVWCRMRPCIRSASRIELPTDPAYMYVLYLLTYPPHRPRYSTKCTSAPRAASAGKHEKRRGKKKKEKEKLSVRHLSTRMGTCRNKVPPYMTPLPSSNNRKPALLDAHIHTKPPTYVPSTFKHLLSRAPVRRRLPCPALPCPALPCSMRYGHGSIHTYLAPRTYCRVHTARYSGGTRHCAHCITTNNRFRCCVQLAGWLAGWPASHRMDRAPQCTAPHCPLVSTPQSRIFEICWPAHSPVCLPCEG
ncbi:hypothetical protein HDK77DRAFT_42970 [Phyllosticta capitalensis]